MRTSALTHPRRTAALGVLLATLIWSIGSLLFKSSLRTAPPLTMAAYQVTLAAGALGVIALARGESRRMPPRSSRSLWLRLGAMGVARYAVGQAAMILALSRLSVNTATFLFSFASLAVMLLGMAFLSEVPNLLQLLGVLLAIAGAYVFFAAKPTAQEWPGIAFSAVNILAFSIYNVIARGVGREGAASNLLVTAVSLACGAPLLLLAAWLVEGPPNLAAFGAVGLAAVVWGGLLDTGLSLSLWNRALRVLWSFEVSVLARAQMVEVPLLAGWLLGDALLPRQWAAILITLVGIVLSQRREGMEDDTPGPFPRAQETGSKGNPG